MKSTNFKKYSKNSSKEQLIFIYLLGINIQVNNIHLIQAAVLNISVFHIRDKIHCQQSKLIFQHLFNYRVINKLQKLQNKNYQMAEKIDKAMLGKPKDVVSQDRNWVLRINSELTSQKTWDNQWGFLSGGFSPQLVNAKPSIDDKIKQLQQQINELGTKDIYSRTNGEYGKGNNVQVFQTNKYNIREGKDLRALQRRLPKNWKKQKWTPPVDPFDPLTNMYKKKK